ncbi:MAG: DNA polymerase III subunit delta' [Clostridiales bacterium]|nr:MAG: DNA polymerase III subunit delta' [Clostridiales bacterium]
MAYSNITGHEPVKRYLKNALAKGVFSHAYLFEGQSGVGKLDMANEFAKAVNCQKGNEEACDECVSCRKADVLNHPDIILTGPDGRSIKNEQVKALQAEMHLKPYESRRKVFIIDSADTMTPQAQNSLLKVLEEPPSSSLVILVSSNEVGLLPTVRSRCQRLHFGRVIKESPAGGISGNSTETSHESAQEPAFPEDRDKSLMFVGDCIKKNTKGMFEFSERIAKADRMECLGILNMIIAWFRDLSLYIETKNGQFIINHDKMDEIKSLARKTNGKSVYKAIEALLEAIEKMHGTVNQQMIVDHLVLKIQEALK